MHHPLWVVVVVVAAAAAAVVVVMVVVVYRFAVPYCICWHLSSQPSRLDVG